MSIRKYPMMLHPTEYPRQIPLMGVEEVVDTSETNGKYMGVGNRTPGEWLFLRRGEFIYGEFRIT